MRLTSNKNTNTVEFDGYNWSAFSDDVIGQLQAKTCYSMALKLKTEVAAGEAAAWELANEKALGILRRCLGSDYRGEIKGMNTFKEAWEKLEAEYVDKEKFSKLSAHCDLMSLEKEESDDLLTFRRKYERFATAIGRSV